MGRAAGEDVKNSERGEGRVGEEPGGREGAVGRDEVDPEGFGGEERGH